MRRRAAHLIVMNADLCSVETFSIKWIAFCKLLFFDCLSFKDHIRWERLGKSDCFMGQVKFVFSRMRSKGSRFTLGVWGLRVCSLDVAFVVATVRNRSQPAVRTPYGRAYGKFCRGGHFWKFPMCRCFVSRGRRGPARAAAEGGGCQPAVAQGGRKVTQCFPGCPPGRGNELLTRRQVPG